MDSGIRQLPHLRHFPESIAGCIPKDTGLRALFLLNLVLVPVGQSMTARRLPLVMGGNLEHAAA
jgi:hypothetical protein